MSSEDRQANPDERLAESSVRHKEFTSLLVSHQWRIHSFIRMFVPFPADADDVMQETAMQMWWMFDKFKPGSNFGAWATTIARYRVLEFRKRRGKHPRQFSEQALEGILAQHTAILETMDVRLRALEQCLTKLNESDRKLLDLRYDKSFSTKVVAGKVGRSVDGIYKSLSRIHNLLRQCVDRTLLAWDMR